MSGKRFLCSPKNVDGLLWGPTNPDVFHKSVALLNVDFYFCILNLTDADCCLFLCLVPPYFILLEVMTSELLSTGKSLNNLF